MKKFKRVFLGVVPLVAAFALLVFVQTSETTAHPNNLQDTSGIDAREIEGWEVRVSDEGFEYLGSDHVDFKIAAVGRVNEYGVFVNIDLEEYAEFLNSGAGIGIYVDFENKAENFVFPIVPNQYRFVPTSIRSNILGTPTRISMHFVGGPHYPTLITAVFQHTFTETIGGDFVMTFPRWLALLTGINFTWNSSASNTTSIGGTWTVPVGYTGYMQFTPFYTSLEGRMYQINPPLLGVFPLPLPDTFIGEFWGQTPQRVGDFADGILELRTFRR